MLLHSYGLALDSLIQAFGLSNSLVAAGALEGQSGRFAVKVPALIETSEDILNYPIAVSGSAAVTLGDLAEVRPTFKDPTSITRINGKPAIAIEVSKRTGANLIETVDATRKVIEDLKRAGRAPSRSPSPRTSPRTSASCCTSCRTASSPLSCWSS